MNRRRNLGNQDASIFVLSGNPIEHFGTIDTDVAHVKQKGAIKPFPG
jgi:hypothetical protein